MIEFRSACGSADLAQTFGDRPLAHELSTRLSRASAQLSHRIYQANAFFPLPTGPDETKSFLVGGAAMPADDGFVDTPSRHLREARRQ